LVPVEVTVPEQVIVSMAEIAESAKEGLLALALAVGTGLQVMAAMFDEDVTRLCSPDGRRIVIRPAGCGSRLVQGVRPFPGGECQPVGGRR
jgi:hypothetical protein